MKEATKNLIKSALGEGYTISLHKGRVWSLVGETNFATIEKEADSVPWSTVRIQGESNVDVIGMFPIRDGGIVASGIQGDFVINWFTEYYGGN